MILTIFCVTVSDSDLMDFAISVVHAYCVEIILLGFYASVKLESVKLERAAETSSSFVLLSVLSF